VRTYLPDPEASARRERRQTSRRRREFVTQVDFTNSKVKTAQVYMEDGQLVIGDESEWKDA